MRRICVILTTRGNFAKTKTAMRAICTSPQMELQLVIGGALLNRQSAIADEIRGEGFCIAGTLDYMLGSESPEGIGASAGLCTLRATDLLSRLQPDILLVIADRYEALALAQAALCLNIRIAHLEGGELSGSIDERIRHAISKLAHYHFPANDEAAKRLMRLGEPGEAILCVGSPSFDLLRDESGVERLSRRLPHFDLARPFLLVSQHPVVTEYAEASQQYAVLMDSMHRLGMPSILVWPNNDAGAQAIAGPLAELRDRDGAPLIVTVGGLPIEEYGAALRQAACLVGNSSSGIREAAFLGTPAVNIGTRQAARARSPNVVDVPCEVEAIVAAVQRQISHGPYPSDERYGNGTAGRQIAEFLANYWPPLDKRMTH